MRRCHSNGPLLQDDRSMQRVVVLECRMRVAPDCWSAIVKLSQGKECPYCMVPVSILSSNCGTASIALSAYPCAQETSWVVPLRNQPNFLSWRDAVENARDIFCEMFT